MLRSCKVLPLIGVLLVFTGIQKENSDKEGVHIHPQYLLDGFREVVDDCNLAEIDFSGGRFTWEKGKDHDPIQLDLYNVQFSKKQFRFKFENTWLREPNFRGEVTKHWDGLPRLQLLPKLISISSFMAKWGRIFFHKFKDKLCKQKEIVNTLASRTDEDSIN
ncbi:uncharacterized protein LOC141692078 [Apium graveolens]|uniref:uncharacterized protein LOC141692078 n=1 Tax=Apium graveolens TaxID=4045 RepID=UPI003D7BDA97